MAMQPVSWQGIAHLHDEHPKNAALVQWDDILSTMPNSIVLWLSVSWISQLLLICGALVNIVGSFFIESTHFQFLS